jgi:outer membrane protein assembly factor BamB
MTVHSADDQPTNVRPSLSRRALLAGVGTGGAALAAASLLTGSRSLAQDATPVPGEPPAPPEGLAYGVGAQTPTALGPALPPEYTDYAGDWPVFNGDITGKRVATSTITSENVNTLGVAWTYATPEVGAFGAWTSSPIIQGDVVYLQDLSQNVHALDRETGEVLWVTKYSSPSVGPGGIAVAYGMVFGATGYGGEAYALDATTGEEVWKVKLTVNQRERVDGTASVYDNTVYFSTDPDYSGGSRGILYALDCKTGAVLWYWDTNADNLWDAPRINAGGGLWYPVSFDEDGNLYFGIGNPSPLPGSPEYPNATSRPGPNLYSSSMVSLDAETGAVRWYYQDAPHDLFDLDFQLSPIIGTITDGGQETPVAIGAGKTGHIVAVNREDGRVVWKRTVGQHSNDTLQEVPEGEVIDVLPGALGGVETSMALDGDTLYAAVVNQPGKYTNNAWGFGGLDYGQATGELYALNANDGSIIWNIQLDQMPLASATVANDLVFSGDLSGRLFAYDTSTGDQVWSFQTAAGLNAPIAIAGDMVIIPSGGPFYGDLPEGFSVTANSVVALKLGATGTYAPAATPEATPVS